MPKIANGVALFISSAAWDASTENGIENEFVLYYIIFFHIIFFTLQENDIFRVYYNILLIDIDVQSIRSLEYSKLSFFFNNILGKTMFFPFLLKHL